MRSYQLLISLVLLRPIQLKGALSMHAPFELTEGGSGLKRQGLETIAQLDLERIV